MTDAGCLSDCCELSLPVGLAGGFKLPSNRDVTPGGRDTSLPGRRVTAVASESPARVTGGYGDCQCQWTGHGAIAGQSRGPAGPRSRGRAAGAVDPPLLQSPWDPDPVISHISLRESLSHSLN